MSAPFQPGDVVVCVDAVSPNRTGLVPTNVKAGKTYRVTCCYVGVTGDWAVTIANTLPRAGSAGFKAWRFRKIDAADEQFTAEMRACRPTKVKA